MNAKLFLRTPPTQTTMFRVVRYSKNEFENNLHVKLITCTYHVLEKNISIAIKRFLTLLWLIYLYNQRQNRKILPESDSIHTF